ncbi:MSL complex subunit 3-like isoform X1 [Haliotis asinina]|uniref:MSL complex subunit 3-like isoform X1 n=1 Tax=Haliotis asinina TaxID=109174 RepID=UPI0035324319
MSTRGIRFNFSVGELVLCFEPDPTKARVLYDAKVLDCQVTKDKHGHRIAAYHIHFQGWNSSWDRIVGENYILKNTEENRTLMKKLADTAKRYTFSGSRKNSQRRRKIDDILSSSFRGKIPILDSDTDDSDNSGDDDDNDGEDGDDDGRSSGDDSSNDTASETRERRRATHTPVDIDIPDILKSRLEDDYVAIIHGDKLTKLPASPCVIEVLEGFMKTFCVNLLCEPSEKEKESRRNNNNGHEHTMLCPPATSIALCKELVDGLRICFDFTIPIILLYDVEREQYNHVMTTIKPPESKKEEKPTSSTSSAVTEEPAAKKQKGAPKQSKHSEEFDNVELSPRRITRRSATHDDAPSSPTVSSTVKHERKRGWRGRGGGGRGGSHSSSHVVKSEPLSDSDIGGSDSAPPPVGNPPVPGSCSGSKDGASEHGYRKEDFLESVLSWQLFPVDSRSKYDITPSQIYGVNHFLRLFVKLPEILNKMDMEDCKMRTLMKLIHHLLRYLVERQEDLFGDIVYIDR